MNSKFPRLVVAVVLFSLLVLLPTQPASGSSTHTLEGPVSVLWENRYGWGRMAWSPFALVVDNSGAVYVTAYGGGYGSYSRMVTLKYSPEGQVLWIADYYQVGESNYPRDMGLDAQGNIYVAGTSVSETRSPDMVVVKYDGITGAELWVARAHYPGANARGIHIDAVGNSYVVGDAARVVDGWMDYILVKYDPLGTEQWVSYYDGPANYDDSPTDIAGDAQGNIYITGNSIGNPRNTCGGYSNADLATVKYDSAGEQQWVARYNGPDNSADRANALTVDELGNVYVTGSSIYWCGGDVFSDFVTTKYDPNGNEVWVRRHASGVGYDIAIDSGGSVYVTGGTNLGQYETIKYDSDGDEAWVRQGPQGVASALVLDDEGNVYITGTAGPDGHYDLLTLKYGRDGGKVWSARYDGDDGSDHGRAIAVDNERDSVYVTGPSEIQGSSSDFGDDFVTINYGDFSATLLDYVGDELAAQGTTSVLRARLTLEATGESLAAKEVTFLITDGTNSFTDQGITDENGEAVDTTTVNLPLGIYTITASFAGDPDSGPSVSLPTTFTIFQPTQNMESRGNGSVGTERVIFTFGVLYRDGVNPPSGHLIVEDPSAHTTVRATGMEWLVVSGNRARFGGACQYNRESCSFVADVTAGNAGVGTFMIQVSNGYSVSGVLERGEITIAGGQ